MIFPSENILAELRRQYPPGCRVRLLKMDDPYSPPPVGTLGTVLGVDDAGNIMARWDNGSGLSVAYGEDMCERITEGGESDGSHA